MAIETFPQGFLWGAATAAYQIEGAANEGGRRESIWDRYSHTPGKTLNGETGDIACDHYHRFREDVALMKQLGFKAYRFSISWPRIYPTGYEPANAEGIAFYNALIDELLAAGIKPFATLYHWDLPQALEDAGGWPNRETAYRFAQYAETCFRAFGDRVKHWITLNEPWCTAYLGYYNGEHAPGRNDLTASLQAGHTLLLANGLATREYREQRLGGKIGITDNFSAVTPASDRPEDLAACQRFDAQMNRWFLDPIYSGKYPQEMHDGFGSLLPRFSADDRMTVMTKPDFVGVNYYTRSIVKDDPTNTFLQTGVQRAQDAKFTEMGWEIYPQGLYQVLTYLRDTYRNPTLYVTENGAAFDDQPAPDGTILDEDRRQYLRDHLRAAHRAITDGVRLGGYFVWSLMDNFEWAYGYSKRFGIVYTDYPTQRRIPKSSALWYSQVIRQNAVGND